jgi:hypothetical protein
MGSGVRRNLQPDALSYELTRAMSSEKPQETNYFLESRNVVPLRSEFKPPPILLSRKGPVIASKKPPADGVANLSLHGESSEEEDGASRPLTLAERQAQAAKDREAKQRKYEERRQELFGGVAAARPKSGSGNSSPGSLTPPNSRSATPNRTRGRGGRRGGSAQSQGKSQRELFDPSYNLKPDSAYVQRRENGVVKSEPEIQPIRAPKGPDGSGRGGFGFAARGGKSVSNVSRETSNSVDTT